jgi:phage-related minor tail protein
MPNANGNAFAGGSVVPFAKGGVVSSPMLFPMSGGQTGLMGEAGPEAIMPLKRGKDGKLGVAAGGSSTQVNIYNSNGGEVTTQERQDPNGGKIIDIMIKKAVASGIASGDFDKAMGSTYGLRRQGTR